MIAGVGGTGVVMLSGVLAQVAQINSKDTAMKVAQLAQKGGAVHIHLWLAETREDISAVQVVMGKADELIGGNLVISAGIKTFRLMHKKVASNFTCNPKFQLPATSCICCWRRGCTQGWHF